MSNDLYLPDWAGEHLLEPIDEPPGFRPRYSRWYSIYGGRDSGKTTTVARLLILEATRRPTRCLCLREFERQQATSVKPALEQAIQDFGLQKHFKTKRNRIECPSTESWFEFAGVGRETSREALRGYHRLTDAWIEEAQRVTAETMNVLVPTVLRNLDCAPSIWMTWNPINRSDYAWQNTVVSPRDNMIAININYNDSYATATNGNRVSFVSEAILEEIEHWKNVDPFVYKHIYGGNPLDEGVGLHVLSYAQVEACVSAYEEGLHEDCSKYPEVVGLDLSADGKSVNDWTATVLRRGPVLEKGHRWKARSQAHTYKLVEERFASKDTNELAYDATGIGSGFGEFAYEMRENLPTQYQYKVSAVKFGELPFNEKAKFSQSHTQKSFFERKNIQMAWALRIRANKTERLLKGDTRIDPNDCLFINPDGFGRQIDILKTELSQPLYEETSAFKIRLDKKGEQKNSPDMFDAACLTMVPDCRRGLRAYTTQ